MENDTVNEQQIELDLETIGKIRTMAWQRSPQTLLALSERLQIKLIVEDLPRRQRQVYRAIIDYFDDVLEERVEKDAATDRKQVRHTVGAYVRNFLKSLDD